MFASKQVSLPVTFIFLGESIPSYAEHSLRIASKFSNQDVLLIGNEVALSRVSESGIQTIAIESFYNPKIFQEVQGKLSGDMHFRDSLWLRSLERFFVLEQFMEVYGREEVFHSELDQFLFNTTKLVNKLRTSGFRGSFVPVHSHKAVVASIFYCNELSSLKDFISFVESVTSFSSEMELLAKWAQSSGSSSFIQLPSTHNYIHSEFQPVFANTRLISHMTIDGVVDPAELGQWFTGIDPRNVPIRQIPRNKFIGPVDNINLQPQELALMHLQFEEHSNQLSLKFYDNQTVDIYNLHIHSKIHSRYFLDNDYFANFLKLINSDIPVRFPGTRFEQIKDFIRSYSRLIVRRLFS